MKRKQFTFYSSYYEAVKVLPKREQAAVLLAICGYALNEEEPRLSGTAEAIFSLIRPTLDASRRKSESGQKGGKQNGSKPQAKRKQTESESYGEKEKENENKKEGENECSSPPCVSPPSPSPEPAAPAPVRHTRSQNGWVKLTDEEYNRLLQELGRSELERCIAYVDESAQMSGNKNKWKDWNLVLRKCHREQWGITGRTGGKIVMASVKQTPSDLQKAALARLMSGEQ